MSGPRDKFDDGDLDELVHDFDLDMDAPLGASFAAALRGGDGEDSIVYDDGAHDIEEEGGFVAPHEAAPPARPQSAQEAVFGAVAHDDEPDEFEDAPRAPQAASQPWLQPKPSTAPVEDLPPMTAHEAEPVADDVAGQGLGYDYAFGAGHDGGDRTIPRIVVHAFCNRTSSLNLMRTIMQDRRMKNVTMEVHEGGVAAATQYYVNETTPNLLVIEGAGDPRQLLADLDSLA
jgi:pilus assembly protein CpaE